jgi:predicted acyl esterase
MDMKDAPIPEHPTFVSFENPKGASRGWRELSAWLPDGTDPLTYVLDGDGKLAETASANPQPAMFHEPSQTGVAFTTDPLAADHVLIGRVTLDLPAKLSAPDAHFYVQILDVDASDKETFVNDGFLKASHRMSHVTPTPVPAGEVVDYHIVVRPQHYRFAAGHRLRVRISSGTMDALVQPDAVDIEIQTGDSAKLRVPNFAAAP